MRLKRVVRLDSIPLTQTYYTEEGYLVDRPVLTSTGIFEYTNDDGSVRRELRLPEEVFAPESLKSYKGKPIIITHDAGLITKDNVHDESVGTILSKGYKDGDNVRAEIIIHDTDEMKDAGLKELSLGYNLELDETPGYWNGKPYDAIQRNIVINHLALVLEARAGEQARLNIDSRGGKSKGVTRKMTTKPRKAQRSRKPATRSDSRTYKKNPNYKAPAKRKAHRNDGVLSPEELEKAIQEYKARQAKRTASKQDADEEEESKVPAFLQEDDDEEAAENLQSEKTDEEEPEEKLQFVKDRRDRRDEEGDPKSTREALGVIAQQDDDMDTLFDIIDTLLAERDFAKDADDEEEKETPAFLKQDADDDEEDILIEDEDDDELLAEDEDDEEFLEDDDDEEEFVEDDDDEEEFVEDGDDEELLAEDCDDNLNEDDDDDLIPSTQKSSIGKTVTKIDSVDKIVRQRVQIGLVGDALHMDGLENMSLTKAKKAVIHAVRPGVRLDGKSKAYVNAMFDCAVNDVMSHKRKDTRYQKKQMFNKDSRKSRSGSGSPSQAARNRMIKRQMNNTKGAK